jgi:hypothetical protein
MMKVMFFANGNATVFDAHGEQVPDLQRPWIEMFLEHLTARDIDPLQCEFTMPDGRKAMPFVTTDGDYNWRIEQ